MTKKLIKNGLRFLAVIGLTFLVLHIGIYVFQDFIVFQPKRLAKNYAFQFAAPFTELWIETQDQQKINALFMKGQPESTTEKKVILYLHGNSDNLQRWAQHHIDFTQRGFDFLAIDYRGYGKSEGRPTEKGLYKDAEAAYDYLTNRYEAEQIYIYGRSLGTGIATFLASEHKAAMLLLETPYYSMQDVLERQAPFLFLPFPLKSKFPLNSYLAKVNIPVYVFHGTEDEIVPYSSAAAIKPNLSAEKNFLTIPGGRHRGLNAYIEYQQYLDQILLDLNPSHLETPNSSTTITPYGHTSKTN